MSVVERRGGEPIEGASRSFVTDRDRVTTYGKAPCEHPGCVTICSTYSAPNTSGRRLCCVHWEDDAAAYRPNRRGDLVAALPGEGRKAHRRPQGERASLAIIGEGGQAVPLVTRDQLEQLGLETRAMLRERLNLSETTASNLIRPPRVYPAGYLREAGVRPLAVVRRVDVDQVVEEWQATPSGSLALRTRRAIAARAA